MAVVFDRCSSVSWPELDYIDDLKGQRCFYCYRPLHPPCVVWRGTEVIYLHPKCVHRLVVRLYRDIHEIEIKSGDEAIHEGTGEDGE